MPNRIVRVVAVSLSAVGLGLVGGIGCGPQQPVRPPDAAPAEEPREPQPAEPAAEPASPSPSTAPIPAPPPVDPPSDAPPARIVGQVVFIGTPEEAPRTNVSSCAYFAAENPEGVLDPKYVVNADGTLPNVILWLDHAPVDAAERPVPAEPAEIVMDARARYRPHVVPMRDGQTLRLRAEAHDTMRPRIRPRLGGDTDRTLRSGQSADVVLPPRDTPYAVTDEEHSWMSAFVRVFRHPWYAATDAAGSFAIEDVPPGTHTLHAWHEKYGKVEVPVTLAPGARVEVRLRLGP